VQGTEFHTAAAVTNDSLVCPENCMHSACLGFACVDPALSVSHGEFHVFKCSLLVLFSFEAAATQPQTPQQNSLNRDCILAAACAQRPPLTPGRRSHLKPPPWNPGCWSYPIRDGLTTVTRHSHSGACAARIHTRGTSHHGACAARGHARGRDAWNGMGLYGMTQDASASK